MYTLVYIYTHMHIAAAIAAYLHQNTSYVLTYVATYYLGSQLFLLY